MPLYLQQCLRISSRAINESHSPEAAVFHFLSFFLYSSIWLVKYQQGPVSTNSIFYTGSYFLYKTTAVQLIKHFFVCFCFTRTFTLENISLKETLPQSWMSLPSHWPITAKKGQDFWFQLFEQHRLLLFPVPRTSYSVLFNISLQNDLEWRCEYGLLVGM